MTDTEKVQFLVDKLWAGKWPGRFATRSPCDRCGAVHPSKDDPCKGWNPITRIEDAFMVVEAMQQKFGTGVTICDACGQPPWFCDFIDMKNQHDIQGDTLQVAIVNAAVKALEEK